MSRCGRDRNNFSKSNLMHQNNFIQGCDIEAFKTLFNLLKQKYVFKNCKLCFSSQNTSALSTQLQTTFPRNGKCSGLHCKKNLGPKNSNSPDHRALHSYSWISIRGICFQNFIGPPSCVWKSIHLSSGYKS